MKQLVPHIVVCFLWTVSSVWSTTSKPPMIRRTANIFAPRVEALVLVNTDTNQPIQTLQNNAVITAISQFAVEAVIDSSTSVGSIQFGYNNNATFRVESIPPFALCGDLGTGRYIPCPELGIGQHTITATPFSEPYAMGDKGPSIQIKFEIANGCSTPKVRRIL
jgi:hypothetical protein